MILLEGSTAPIYTSPRISSAAGMEASNVLVVLEESERWRSRKARLEKELIELRRRRWTLRAELEKVKRELTAIEEALFEPPETATDTYAFPPFQPGR